MTAVTPATTSSPKTIMSRPTLIMPVPIYLKDGAYIPSQTSFAIQFAARAISATAIAADQARRGRARTGWRPVNAEITR